MLLFFTWENPARMHWFFLNDASNRTDLRKKLEHFGIGQPKNLISKKFDFFHREIFIENWMKMKNFEIENFRFFRTKKSTFSDPNWPCSSRLLWNVFGSKRGENYDLLLSKNIWFPYAPEHARRWKVYFTFVGLLRLWIRHETLISVPVSWNHTKNI